MRCTHAATQTNFDIGLTYTKPHKGERSALFLFIPANQNKYLVRSDDQFIAFGSAPEIRETHAAFLHWHLVCVNLSFALNTRLIGQPYRLFGSKQIKNGASKAVAEYKLFWRWCCVSQYWKAIYITPKSFIAQIEM
jgi:hypothetical protein